MTKYHFATDAGMEFVYTVRLGSPTDTALPDSETGPEWTRLENHQCACCPLKTADVAYCPLAVQISKVVSFFSDIPSYSGMDVTITNASRQIHMKTDAQNGMRSLLGLIMAVSSCPKTRLLRPMAHYHLPLSTIEETSYRVASMYMLAQYFIHHQGKQADWRMQNLDKMYGDIHTVNAAMLKRLQHQMAADAPANALIILDMLGTYITQAAALDFADMQWMFSDWIKQAPSS